MICPRAFLPSPHYFPPHLPSFPPPHNPNPPRFTTRSSSSSSSCSSSSSSSSSKKEDRHRDVWINPQINPSTLTLHRHRRGGSRYMDRSVDMDALLSSLKLTKTPAELHSLMSPFVVVNDDNSNGAKQQHLLLSLRFMVSLLSRDPDRRRNLCLLDWMHGVACYPPSTFTYNVVIRNSLRSLDFPLALGLFHEMRSLQHISPDHFTYSSLISSLTRRCPTHQEEHLHVALSLLTLMDEDGVPGDLVLYTNLIDLARRLGDPSKALIIFSRLKSSTNIAPDIVLYNSIVGVLAQAGLFKDARQVLAEMPETGVEPDTVTYSALLAGMVEKEKYLEALSLFEEMRGKNVALDATVCNVLIDCYGKLGMAREADRLFWAMRRVGVEPSVVTYNTMLRVYGDAELFGEAIHLFRLMDRKEIEKNVVTYNTMIGIYGKSLEHEKAGNLIPEMKRKGIEPNGVTYSTIISIWGKAGKLDRAVTLFQKLRSSGAKIDPILYQTMIVVYERAGLVGHAKRLIHELRYPEDEEKENNVSRETSISVLAKAGRVEEAVWVFRRAVEAEEVKDISAFRSMMDLFARNRRHKNVIEVFEAMRRAGFFPDSEMTAMILNAYGKLQETDKAETLYREMMDDGCIFTDRVHFQMMSLLGAKRDFEGVEELLKELNEYPNINKKELHLVAANVYEMANKLDEAARIIGQVSKRSSNVLAVQ